MIQFADPWDTKPAKAWHSCIACGKIKIIIWLAMCGCCAVEHKKRTAESVEQMKQYVKELQERRKAA